MKDIKILIIILILLACSATTSVLWLKEKANSRRLTDNISVLQSEARQFTTKDGHQASKTDALILQPSEVKKLFPEVNSQLKNMYIPASRTESFTDTRSVTDFTVRAANRDSLIKLPVLPGKIQQTQILKTFHYSDKWKSINGLIAPDTTFIRVAAVDSIFTAIYRGDRRHPWAWILSRRKLQVAATNRNPDNTITVIQGGVIKR